MEVLDLKAILGPGFPLSCIHCIHTSYIGENSLPENIGVHYNTTPKCLEIEG